MKNLLLSAALFLLANVGLAASIDPSATSFPWMNGPTRDARYSLSEHVNTVHVFEAWSITCSWCNRNAEQVQELANEYQGDDRVQFIDLGLDTDDRSYQRWIQTHNPSYPVVKDVDHAVFDSLSPEDGIPQTYVVACDGTRVDYTIGYWGDEEKETIREAIARAKETTCQ